MSNDKAQATYGRDDSDGQRELREAMMRFNERARAAGYSEDQLFVVSPPGEPWQVNYGPVPTHLVQKPKRAYNLAVNIVAGLVISTFVVFVVGMLALVFIGAARILF